MIYWIWHLSLGISYRKKFIPMESLVHNQHLHKMSSFWKMRARCCFATVLILGRNFCCQGGRSQTLDSLNGSSMLKAFCLFVCFIFLKDSWLCKVHQNDKPNETKTWKNTRRQFLSFSLKSRSIVWNVQFSSVDLYFISNYTNTIFLLCSRDLESGSV